MYGKMYEEIVDSIAAQYAPIQGQSCKEPGSFPVYLAPADVCGIGGLDTTLKIYKYYPRMETDYYNLSPPCMRVIGGTHKKYILIKEQFSDGCL